MKCEICGKTPMVPPNGDGVTLHRVNELGVVGIWRCTEHLTKEQAASLDPETVRLVGIIVGRPAEVQFSPSGIPLNKPVLLPCPFCGSAPEIVFTGNNNTAKRSVVVKCPRCRVQRTDCGITAPLVTLTKWAVEQWNMRHEKS